MPVNDRDFALVVGINHYPNYGSQGRPLKGAIGDAEDFHRWLLDPDTGGGLPAANCQLIRSSIATVDPPQPKKARIDEALETIWNASKSTGARRLYFYFSGHGQTQTHDDVALCMSNWAINRQAAAISFRKYLDFIVECTAFEEIVMLMDCCRSRKIGARGQETELTCPLPDAGSPKIFVAHATGFQTTAHEAVTGVLTADNEPLVRGHFTRALMAGLQGSAARGLGGVTVSGLALFLKKVVPRIAKRSQHEQEPQPEMRNFVPGGPDEPVLGAATRVETVDVTIHFTAARTSRIRLDDPRARPIRVGEASTGPWEETLEAATHLLTDLETGEEMPLKLHEFAGEAEIEF